ncbi:hypothetical protein ACFOD9_03355 [Novosphingobium bradum]|uniref:Uncharacterized protein n=1 Tax=Novosphingobium bradum TaxID=1737444 RepID=A0ABV7IL09_9SPHN
MTLHRLPPIALVPALLLPVLLGAASPALAARPLSADERLGLTCASAFALVAAGQARGEPGMAAYPPLAARGREYFVRLAAQLMDDAGLDQAGIRAAAESEAAPLRRAGVAGVMPSCLAALDRELPPPAR